MKPALAVIVISQFLCTSLWFATNAIMPDILQALQLAPGFLAHLTSAVQLGFILGTLVFAVLTISDRFSPSRVFFTSALIAAFFNLAIGIGGLSAAGLLGFRFLTGFFLAGIYPVGMKIASDYYQQGLGKSLGLLVGALVVGTAFPHLLKSMGADFPWRQVVFTTSALSVAGGFTLLAFVPDGPYRRPGPQLRLTALLQGFRKQEFRSAAFGYFGHMWELYAFWTFVPLMLTTYNRQYPGAELNVPLFSFLIIASGGGACVGSGLLSQNFSPRHLAALFLSVSGLCCLLSPVFLLHSSAPLLLLFLFTWGLAVIADSPLFSTLVAQQAPEAARGTALTIVNCIGFSITIVSMQLVNALSGMLNAQYMYMVLAIGPILGLLALVQNKTTRLR